MTDIVAPAEAGAAILLDEEVASNAAAPASAGATGVLAGIARHAVRRGPMETVAKATITRTHGVLGDYRGAMKGGPHRRQVTLMEAGDWAAALAEVGRDLPWQERRVNLLVEGLDLPQRAGTRLRVGSALLEVTIECDPCKRMDALVDGLQAALRDDWRGGVCTQVIENGAISVGDEIRIEA